MSPTDSRFEYLGIINIYSLPPHGQEGEGHQEEDQASTRGMETSLPGTETPVAGLINMPNEGD